MSNEQSYALGVAIAAMKTYGAIINGDNCYRAEIATLEKMRKAIHARQKVCGHYNVRRATAETPFTCNDCGATLYTLNAD